MSGFTKLFESITDSTIWRAPDTTRLVWITMLAMADQNGYVAAAVPGLADRARVSMDACLAALAVFQEPDEWSRTKDNEGRRIAEVDGGWLLLNHAKYRAIRAADERREYMRNLMAKKRALAPVSNVSRRKPKLAKAEAEAEAEAKEEQKQEQEQEQEHELQAARFDAFWSLYPVKKGKQDALKAWAKLKPSDTDADAIMFKLRKQSELDDDWLRGFAPHPATYLNGQRWNDEIKTPKAPAIQPGRTMQGVQILEGMKNGLADTGNSNGFSETALLGSGTPARR